MPSKQYVRDLARAVVEAAKTGEPYPFIFAPPLGPLRTSVTRPLRDALAESGNLPLVVDVLLRGAQHPNPRIRYECGHAMDWLADERCVPALLKLAQDPVPRVRWVVTHSLACDDCKLTPLSSGSDVLPTLRAMAEHDPSERVRRGASFALQLIS